MTEVYRPTELARDRALSWWITSEPSVPNEIECKLCLDEIMARADGAPDAVWSANAKRSFPFGRLWAKSLDHLLRRHGVVIEPSGVPS